MARLVLQGQRTVLELGSAGFPEPLAQIPSPPERLYVLGDPSCLQPGLAVIGARRATPYGKSCARHFATLAAEKGVRIISGGARGCDSESHRAALACHEPTVVFLGGGCDRYYPACHGTLFQQVIDGGGAVVSEHPWDTAPLPYMFRMRNRLIAGLAQAVLIVEKKSDLVILENVGFPPSAQWGICATSWDYAKAAHGDSRSFGLAKPAPNRESP